MHPDALRPGAADSSGNALDDAIANYFAGEAQPQGIVDTFAKAVSNQ